MSKPVPTELVGYPVGGWPRDVSITADRPDLVVCSACTFAMWVESGTLERLAAAVCPACRAVIRGPKRRRPRRKAP
jgi:uncharacterized paraquat-inducible protein A